MSITSIVTSQRQGSAANHLLPDRDDLLQASRRVDWRFLLPVPELTEVAVIAGTDPSLIESLRHLAKSVVILDPAAPADCAGRFSLAVAGNPTADGLVRAVQAACCGGSVYIEVRRQPTPATGSVPARPNGRVKRWLAEMSRLHVTGLQAHWHWPDFESCTEIVPLLETAAVRCTLRRRGTGFRSRWKTRLASLLLHGGLFEAFVPCFSILGQRFQQEDSSNRPIYPWGK